MIYTKKGIDVPFLKKFKKFITEQQKRGRRFVIVTGGGAVCRDYQRAAEKISKVGDKDLDWIGIKATKLNAELLRAVFGKLAYGQVIDNPAAKIKTAKKIIIGSGWLPGSSSDKDAVLLAKNFSAKLVVNLSNIDYVYDKDPKKFKNAQKIEKIPWKAFIKIVGAKWDPGNNSPFGPIASRLAAKAKIEAAILNGKNLINLKRFLEGKKFKGTIIY